VFLNGRSCPSSRVVSIGFPLVTISFLEGPAMGRQLLCVAKHGHDDRDYDECGQADTSHLD